MRRILQILFAAVVLPMSACAGGEAALHLVFAKACVVESADSDSDGLVDPSEAAIGTDPAVADTDGDGLSDGDEEILLNISAKLADCDRDGFGDGLEVAAGSDPLSTSSVPVTVSGTVVNGTSFAGPVRASLSVSNMVDFITNNTAKTQVCRGFAAAGCPAAFTFTNAVASGAAFSIEAWADVNTNGVWEAWEPAGLFVSDGVSAPGLEGVTVVLDCDNFVDSDGNGLDDVWEWRHFGSLGNSASADPDYDGLDNAGECQWRTDPQDDDTDGDGMTDGDEALVGFNPSMPDKLPRVNLHRTTNGMFRIEWDTRYFQGYMPQYTDSLVPPAWSNLVPRALYEFDEYPYGTMSVIDINTNAPMRFYRIKLVK